ncbi:hypothetical protein V8G54_033316 [Vigna mungo]|uniref:Endoplasmic reticulum resident protein 29 C-terminal domain-containing protein n=1 Tax=Vigna mungo TaxID=3915 RepID=A0AAQ3RIU7_VIGMU
MNRTCLKGVLQFPLCIKFLNDFVAFINEKCGTYRDGKGQLSSKADDNDKKAVYSQLEEEVKKLKGSAARYGSLYLKLAKKSMEKGTNYAKNEILRLDHMLEKMDDVLQNLPRGNDGWSSQSM